MIVICCFLMVAILTLQNMKTWLCKREERTQSTNILWMISMLVKNCLCDVQVLMEMEHIPQDMVLNWDNTSINYVPISSGTMAKEDLRRVDIAGLGDKKQITLVIAGLLSGVILPFQVIYCGKTKNVFRQLIFLKNGMYVIHQTTALMRLQLKIVLQEFSYLISKKIKKNYH